MLVDEYNILKMKYIETNDKMFQILNTIINGFMAIRRKYKYKDNIIKLLTTSPLSKSLRSLSINNLFRWKEREIK